MRSHAHIAAAIADLFLYLLAMHIGKQAVTFNGDYCFFALIVLPLHKKNMSGDGPRYGAAFKVLSIALYQNENITGSNT